MCRSGRIGGASGSVTLGNCRSRERRRESWSGAEGEGAAFADQKAVGGDRECSVVVLCQEGARAPCCTRDEGGPFGAVL